jgi:quercetin dioxygenase-like cupin family protein
MRRSMQLATLIALFAFVIRAGTALGQDLPPGPQVVYRATMEVSNPPAVFDTVSLVLDFAPGASTPLHSHGGQGIVTVLEGELVHRPEGGEERRLRPGESFLETPGHPHIAANDSQANTRVAFTVLLPKGAQLTTVSGEQGGQDLPPGPQVVYRATMEVSNPPAAFDTINLVLDFAPGASTPLHSHGGQGIVTVLEGELVHRPEGGEERRLRPGESFPETPGHPHIAANDSGANARVLFTALLPKGAQLTTVQSTPQSLAPPAALPKTGEHPAASEHLWVAVLASAGLLAAGWLLRRKRRSANKAGRRRWHTFNQK